jgi:Asp-tRNA(Asn)/Glu-tRNA(Gln) amidotransferase A subunit family amidase
MKSTKIRRLVSDDFKEAFKKVDVIITPTSTGEPPKIGQVWNITYKCW